VHTKKAPVVDGGGFGRGPGRGGRGEARGLSRQCAECPTRSTAHKRKPPSQRRGPSAASPAALGYLGGPRTRRRGGFPFQQGSPRAGPEIGARTLTNRGRPQPWSAILIPAGVRRSDANQTFGRHWQFHALSELNFEITTEACEEVDVSSAGGNGVDQRECQYAEFPRTIHERRPVKRPLLPLAAEILMALKGAPRGRESRPSARRQPRRQSSAQ
jgi:hypothetical protein